MEHSPEGPYRRLALQSGLAIVNQKSASRKFRAERKAQDCTLFITRQSRGLGSKPKGRNSPQCAHDNDSNGFFSLIFGCQLRLIGLLLPVQCSRRKCVLREASDEPPAQTVNCPGSM